MSCLNVYIWSKRLSTYFCLRCQAQERRTDKKCSSCFPDSPLFSGMNRLRSIGRVVHVPIVEMICDVVVSRQSQELLVPVQQYQPRDCPGEVEANTNTIKAHQWAALWRFLPTRGHCLCLCLCLFLVGMLVGRLSKPFYCSTHFPGLTYFCLLCPSICFLLCFRHFTQL